jgi:hypothetical protein
VTVKEDKPLNHAHHADTACGKIHVIITVGTSLLIVQKYFNLLALEFGI